MKSENNLAYNLLHILLIFFIICVIYLYLKNINISLILDKDTYSQAKKTVRKPYIGKKEINTLTSTNQSVVPYTNKDINQKVYIQEDAYLKVGTSLIQLVFDSQKENYSNQIVYKLGDVVKVKDNGNIRNFVNLVLDSTGCINQDPLKDNKAWLEIIII